MTDQKSSRDIHIEQSAPGSIIISGDNNVVHVFSEAAEPVEVASRSETRGSSTQLGPNPYKGLTAFKESDAGRYFGREAQVKRLWENFRDVCEYSSHDAPVYRFVPILGPSGCGKSSLARAGLIPELARNPLPGQENLRIAVMKPGHQPLTALANTLINMTTSEYMPVTKSRELVSELKRKNFSETYDGLSRAVDLIPNIKDSPLVILIDQFEEIYSLCKNEDDRIIFLENIFEAVSSLTRNLSVIATIRSDFLGEAQSHPTLNKLVSENTFLVPAMSQEEFKGAIVKPAAESSYKFSTSTVNLLVEQMKGQEGALPLLQFALTRIWEGLVDGCDPTDVLEEMGGVGGALATEAQRIYNRLNDSEKSAARRLFSRLVQFGEGERYIGKPATIESLLSNTDDPFLFQKVVDEFSKPSIRLITTSGDGKRKRANVAHEALFEYWEELNDWLNKNKALIKEHQSIEFFVSEWEQAQSADYLPRGHQLEKMKKFQTEHSSDFPLSATTSKCIRLGIRQQRNRRIISRSLLLSGIFFVFSTVGIGITQEKHRQEESKILTAGFESPAEPDLLSAAYRLLTQADTYKEGGETEQALYHYRALMNYASLATDEPSNIFNCSRQIKSFENVYCTAEMNLVSLLKKERFLELENQIQNGEIGELLSGNRSDFEYIFSEGALRGTYSLLWREQGAKADIDDSGTISKLEAERISCLLLKSLEEIWAKQTNDRCGWIDHPNNTLFTDLDCGELNGNTLTMNVVEDIADSDYVIARLQACDLVPMNVDEI